MAVPTESDLAASTLGECIVSLSELSGAGRTEMIKAQALHAK